MYAKDKETVIDRREMLRVKLKSLMEEAKIIRKEERRTWGVIREQLWYHRTQDIRIEARATHLAYGFIKGYDRDKIEPSRRIPEPGPNGPAIQEKRLLEKVDAMVKKYGPKKKV